MAKRSATPRLVSGCPKCHKRAERTDGEDRGNVAVITYSCKNPECDVVWFDVATWVGDDA